MLFPDEMKASIMKTSLKNFFLLPALIAGLGLTPTGRVAAQTFTTLHNFTVTSTNTTGVATNSDGASPWAGLILTSNTLYGTAIHGGTNGTGTVFALNTDGTGFTTLHNFTATDSSGINSDGANPTASLILSGNTLYGVTYRGSISNAGCVFSIDTNGTGFTVLHSFTYYGSDGGRPYGSLILSGNALYGATTYGGEYGNGTLFAVNTNGTGFTVLYTFTASQNNSLGYSTNSDGANPNSMILSGNTLYGTAWHGGSASSGTLFSLNMDGSGFTVLHSFTATSTNNAGVATNSDGATATPNNGMVLSGKTLYGTASVGGMNGNGTVFAVNTNGTGFTVLHSFTATSTNNAGVATNSDGANSYAGLTLSGNTLYGTARYGGTSDCGTVFSLSYPSPELTINCSGTNVNVTWPSGVAGYSYSGYTLQSTTNLDSPVVWTTNSPPVVVNGQNTVTNPISGKEMFFRLSQ